MFFLNLIVFTSLFYKTREILLQMWEGWICVEKKIVWSCNLWNIYSSSARAMKRMNHQVQGHPAVNSNKCYETFGNLHSQRQRAVSRVPDRSQVARYFSTRFCKRMKNDDNIDNLFDERLKLTRTFSHYGRIAFCLVRARAPYWLHNQHRYCFDHDFGFLSSFSVHCTYWMWLLVAQWRL